MKKFNFEVSYDELTLLLTAVELAKNVDSLGVNNPQKKNDYSRIYSKLFKVFGERSSYVKDGLKTHISFDLFEDIYNTIEDDETIDDLIRFAKSGEFYDWRKRGLKSAIREALRHVGHVENFDIDMEVMDEGD